MLQAKVTITVRQASEAASVVDIQGEITGFAESMLMDAYMQASAGKFTPSS